MPDDYKFRIDTPLYTAIELLLYNENKIPNVHPTDSNQQVLGKIKQIENMCQNTCQIDLSDSKKYGVPYTYERICLPTSPVSCDFQLDKYPHPITEYKTILSFFKSEDMIQCNQNTCEITLRTPQTL